MVKATPTTVIFMVIYLSLISLTPFTCSLIGNHLENPVSYVIFGIVTELIFLNGYLFLRYLRKHQLYHKNVDFKAVEMMEKSVGFIIVFIAGQYHNFLLLFPGV